MLLVCDQPFVDAKTIEELIALRAKTEKTIVASSYSDTLGVPALFDRSCFQELLALNDASGAKAIILSNRERVAEFPFPQGKIDIDTVEDLEQLAPRRQRRCSLTECLSLFRHVQCPKTLVGTVTLEVSLPQGIDPF